MSPRQLRLIIRRFGKPGIMFVSAYLGLLYLWKKRWSGAVAAVLLCGFFGLFLLRHNTEPPYHHASSPVSVPLNRPLSASSALSSALLSEHARKVMDIEGYWDEEEGCDNYRWLSNHELLYAPYTGEGAGRIEIPRLYRYDTITHTRTQLKRLARGVGALYQSQMEVSPDGKWLLWHGSDDRGNTLDAAALDGKQHLQWPGGYWLHHILAWTGDSRHWIEFRRETSDAPVTQAILHDVSAPKVNRVLSVPLRCLCTVVYPEIAAYDYLISLSSPEDGDAQRPIQVVEASLTPSLTPIRQYAIRLPSSLAHPDIERSRLSPHGDKVALVVGYDTSLRSRCKNQRLDSLWICHRDGSHMHEVGMWLEEKDLDWILELDWIRWLPSGKGLSFVYDGALCMIDIEDFAR